MKTQLPYMSYYKQKTDSIGWMIVRNEVNIGPRVIASDLQEIDANRILRELLELEKKIVPGAMYVNLKCEPIDTRIVIKLINTNTSAEWSMEDLKRVFRDYDSVDVVRISSAPADGSK